MMSDAVTLPEVRHADVQPSEFWIHDRGDLRPFDADAALNSKPEPGLPLADAKVAAARFDVLTKGRTSRHSDRAFLDQCALAALGFKLPYDWTGDVHIRRPALVGSAAPTVVDEPGLYRVCLVVQSQERSSAPLALELVVLKACSSREEADDLADRLLLINAYSQFTVENKLRLLERRALRLARRPLDVAL
jgi:hypothetical protein